MCCFSGGSMEKYVDKWSPYMFQPKIFFSEAEVEVEVEIKEKYPRKMCFSGGSMEKFVAK